MNKVTVNILGESFTIRGDADAERIKAVATLLNNRMRAVVMGNPTLPHAKVAILAGLNLAEEYMHLDEDYKLLLRMIDEDKQK